MKNEDRKTIWKGVRLKEKWKNDDIFLQQTIAVVVLLGMTRGEGRGR